VSGRYYVVKGVSGELHFRFALLRHIYLYKECAACPQLRQEGVPGTLPGSVAMKAQKIDPHLNSFTIASHHKAKNARPVRLRKSAIAGTQTHLVPYKNDQTRQTHLKTLQARIAANTYHVDSTAIAQQMLKPSITRRMLDIVDWPINQRIP